MSIIEATVKGYSIKEQIYVGTRTLVYRGIREGDEKPVILKLMRQEYPSFNELVQFRNQYTIAKNFNILGIVKPYSLETYRNGYALIMEDFGGVSLKDWGVRKNADKLSYFWHIGIQVTQTLDELHRHRVIHKDIKPANILINPETSEVKLIDFSIASLLPRETQQLQNPNVLEGTLAYISPEQTGRMNRGIDYRTDFYSLGVTFFELLTGQLPFKSNDPIELVHCHIAKQPPSVHSINPNIPPILSDIVAKLMAKNAEDRYQSASGVKYDLEICRKQWQETGTIVQFELGSRDICDRFCVPEKLYGREAEVATLLDAFDRVSNPPSSPLSKGGLRGVEIMLVAGFSGIGKTAVVNEVHKPIVAARGYFIKGKYDQFQRNIPFSAFVQAFRDLMGQLLSESDAQLQQWKTKILQALGENAQVIIEVIPELGRIIGNQPAVLELSGIAAQNRFNLLFQKFIQVFTTKEHPLVIFLDDLQWADSASLKLMQLLMSESDTGYLLLIGAYRDNEVSPTHPLMVTLEDIGSLGATINTITLSPLNQADLNHLIADTLNCSESLALPLTELVYQKTKGNPFFSNQFLKSLYEDGLITFNFEIRYWQCDIAQVKALALTDDVVQFMGIQLQKLPNDTQEVLKLAACIGNSFDLNTLSIVHEKSAAETAVDLWRALQEGLILPQSEIYKFYQDATANSDEQLAINNQQLAIYKFLHDRVQQAAYFLIPENEKQSTHLKIGQLLLNNTPEAQREENIFEIVNQLNIGFNLITNQSEKKQLAELNLLAARKAKLSTAYEPALRYLNVGLSLLDAEAWLESYNLTLKLYVEATEVEYLSTNFTRANELAELVLQQAKNLLDQVKIYELKIQIFLAQAQELKAIETGLKLLEMLGVNLEVEAPQNLIIEELINLPEITDSEKLAAMRILSKLIPASYMANPALLPQIIYTMIHLSVKHGNSAPAAFAYVMYALLLCGMLGDIESGYRYGELALKLLDKFDAREYECRVLFVFNAQVRHWKEPIHEAVEPFWDALHKGLETGDMEFAGYSSFYYCSNSLSAAEHLESVKRKLQQCHDLMLKVKQEFAINAQNIYQQMVLNLLAKSEEKYNLIGTAFNEVEMLPILREGKNSLLLFSFYLQKAIGYYLFKEKSLAVEYAKLAGEYSVAAVALMGSAEQNFYYSLALLSEYPHAESQQQQYLEQVEVNQKKMQEWAEHAPHNFEHKYNLVAAEKARVLGQNWQAVELYDSAIAGAKNTKFIQEEALANELAAQFYLSQGKEKIAQLYITDAYYAYARWGAKAKVDDLEKRYPELLAPILKREENVIKATETFSSISTATLHSTSKETSSFIDLATVMKASQVISGEIHLEQLLKILMQVVLENAGATKCVLILQQAGQWIIEATGCVNQAEAAVLQSIPLESSSHVPVSLINYVARTAQTLVIDDANSSSFFQNYNDISTKQLKSLMCIPVVNQAKLIGILYLENNLTTVAFTSDRVELLNLLTSQAAISLENATLYQKAQKHLSDLQQMQLQLVQNEKMSALGNLVAGVAHEINNPVGFIAGNIQPAADYVQDLFHVIEMYQDKLPNPGAEIESEIEAIDLEYVREDLPKLLHSMKEGVVRIRSISNSLRTFSRADTENKIPFNIHDGIDSTIMILKHRLKASQSRPEIEVIKNYGQLPPVKCFPGQVNQVFMNILANAIDALEEFNTGRSFREIEGNPNRITITTSISSDKVLIQIADNGMGMSPEVRCKIFDHLYTTKGVGKGTGLGLAIARQIIVEKHGGSLEVNSTLGEGAEFVISIPV